MEAKPQFHGSDTAAVAAFYHVPVDEIVCFGANVNPLGLSKNLKKDLAAHLDLLSSYPDRNYTTLKKVIADYCQILPEHVIVGNGSTELISLLIQTRKPQKKRWFLDQLIPSMDANWIWWEVPSILTC